MFRLVDFDASLYTLVSSLHLYLLRFVYAKHWTLSWYCVGTQADLIFVVSQCNKTLYVIWPSELRKK